MRTVRPSRKNVATVKKSAIVASPAAAAVVARSSVAVGSNWQPLSQSS